MGCQLTKEREQPLSDLQDIILNSMFNKCLCVSSFPEDLTLELEAEPKPDVKPFLRKKGGIKLYTRPSEGQIPTDDNDLAPEANRRKTMGPHISFQGFNIDRIKARLRRNHPTKFNLLPDELKAMNSHRPTSVKSTTCYQSDPILSLEALCVPCPPLTSFLSLPLCQAQNIQRYSISKKYSSSETYMSEQPPISKLDKFISRRISSIQIDASRPLQEPAISKLDKFVYRRISSIEINMPHHLSESHHVSPEKVVPIVEQSLIVSRSVIDNFVVIRKLADRDGCDVSVAIEKNIGMVVTLKVYKEMDLNQVSEEIRINKILKDGHPALLRIYNGGVDGNNGYVMIKEYYETTLRDVAVLRVIGENQLRDYMKQLLSVFEYLCEKGIELHHTSLQDIAIVNGMCKLTNLESCSFVEADSENLNLYYTRKLADIIRSIMSIGSFMAAAIGSDIFGCSSFLTTLETEHLSLRLIARHPYLNQL